jgi:hypothetical protein
MEMERTMQQMLQQLLAMQAKGEADRIAHREFMRQMMAKMDSRAKKIRSELDEMTTCQEAAATEPDSRMMQSIEEHQDFPKEKAAVMSVGEPRKRRRVCNLATECRQ